MRNRFLGALCALALMPVTPRARADIVDITWPQLGDSIAA